MELPELIARIVEAQPDLAEKMPRQRYESWFIRKEWTFGMPWYFLPESDARLIVQGIVAKELGRWFEQQHLGSRMMTIPIRNHGESFLEAQVALLLHEIARAT